MRYHGTDYCSSCFYTGSSRNTFVQPRRFIACLIHRHCPHQERWRGTRAYEQTWLLHSLVGRPNAQAQQLPGPSAIFQFRMRPLSRQQAGFFAVQEHHHHSQILPRRWVLMLSMMLILGLQFRPSSPLALGSCISHSPCSLSANRVIS